MTCVEDVPHDFTAALFHAHRILDWQENLMEGEMPPEWMWPFEDELQIWFERVDEARKEKYGGGGSSSSSGDEGLMMGNEMAAGRGRNG